MGRKPNAQDHVSSFQEKHCTTDIDTNNLYRKRLRSWKRTSPQLKPNPISVLSVVNNVDIMPLQRSTIYTYPINFNTDRRCILSNTIPSESLTTESVFYCPSISNTSIQTTGDLNNNHVTTLNVEKSKRKNRTLPCESLSSENSSMTRLEMLPNPNDEKNFTTQQSSVTNLQPTYHQSSPKRSRLYIDDSIVANHRSLNSTSPVDGDTIDINQLDQQEPLFSSMDNESSINNSTPMQAAVKMVQPIVDIIFSAFEDQLKQVQTKPIHSSLSTFPLTNVSTSKFKSPIMFPYLPVTQPTHPIVLHAVNFNIQLTTNQAKLNSIENQTSTEQYLTNITSNKNNHLQSISLTEFKRKVVTDNLLNDQETHNDHQTQKRKLIRIVQLAVLGVSVLCGYLFL